MHTTIGIFKDAFVPLQHVTQIIRVGSHYLGMLT